jgi:hypothetical protein
MKTHLSLVRRRLPLAAFSLAAALAVSARADGPPGPPPPPTGPVVGSGTPARERRAIAWYGTLAGARAEARRSGRPILLLSAAPQCRGISGVW